MKDYNNPESKKVSKWILDSIGKEHELNSVRFQKYIISVRQSEGHKRWFCGFYDPLIGPINLSWKSFGWKCHITNFYSLEELYFENIESIIEVLKKYIGNEEEEW